MGIFMLIHVDLVKWHKICRFCILIRYTLSSTYDIVTDGFHIIYLCFSKL